MDETITDETITDDGILEPSKGGWVSGWIRGKRRSTRPVEQNAQ